MALMQAYFHSQELNFSIELTSRNHKKVCQSHSSTIQQHEPKVEH